MFLAGSHSLQTAVTLESISDVTLRGEGNGSQVNFVINWNNVLQFTKVINVTIEGIAFLLQSSRTQFDPTALSITFRSQDHFLHFSRSQ